MPAPMLYSERLLIRPWRDADLAPFAALNADAEVMRYFPSTLTRADSDALAGRMSDRAKQRGYGFLPIERQEDGVFMGFVGLSAPHFDALFTPCVEIGWRLARPYWGRGYAYEAARVWLEYGFQTLRLDEIVSFTTVANRRSRALMERLGMRYSRADDFDHPDLSSGHALRRHVLYRLSRGVNAKPPRHLK